MKQLIFNPDKDMSELEKYGFEYCNCKYCCYGVPHYEYNYEIVIPLKDCYISKGEIGMNGVEHDINRISPIIYDLIKANLLIVEEKDE